MQTRLKPTPKCTTGVVHDREVIYENHAMAERLVLPMNLIKCNSFIWCTLAVHFGAHEVDFGVILGPQNVKYYVQT